jgi:flavin reductase (DIM6/NTAB) family NADH-FMN oxidoreductase RutF
MTPTNSEHRHDVPLPQAYRLINHGPTVLVSAAHGGRHNVMAAAWAMPLDFDPPKVTVVIDKNTFTRTLIEASGHFALSVPCRALADATYAAGSLAGAERADKFADCGLVPFAAQRIAAPMVEGCVAWLECRVIGGDAERHHEQTYDLFVAEVVAAQADARVFAHGRWNAEAPASLRTLHHQGGGAFFVAGETVQAAKPAA